MQNPREKFLQTKVNKILILSAVLLTLIYFYIIAFTFVVSNSIVFYLLIFGEVFHVFQFMTFLYTIWNTEYMPEIKDPNFSQPVDVFITVCGEPVQIVEETIIAAKKMDYPNFKIFILNDGLVASKDNWQEIDELALKHGVTSITRTIPGGAKAGNINHAISKTSAPYITIFDADHVPHTDFLKKTMLYFADEKVAYVQTPQFYKNSDVNIITESAWEQQELFFGPICKGKNRDNSATMCGTNMVLSRLALSEVGGMWEASIAEDLLTGILLHERKYKSVYVPEVLAEGLAPEDFLSYFNQQFRWARGALDVIFKHNIIFRGIFSRKNKTHGLTFKQRLQYMSSVCFFLSGIVVVIDACIPLIYFFTGAVPIVSSTMLLASVFLPYIFLTLLLLEQSTNYSFTFSSLCFSNSGFNIHIKALWAALTNKKSKFEVTSKKAVEGNFIKLVIPQISYIVLVIVGVGYSYFREGFTASFFTNTAWALLNIGIFVPFIYAALPQTKKTELQKVITKVKTISSFQSNVIISGLLIFAALLSKIVFSLQSLRLDESQSLWQTSHSPAKILNLIGQDVHVPLYHFTLYIWRYFLGDSIEVARLLSLIFFLASIVLIYFVGKRAYNSNVGIYASILLAASAFMNWYGSEIRMYTMFVFLVLLSQYLFVSLWKNPSKKVWIGYTLISIIGMYVHYFFSLFIITQVIFYFLNTKIFPEGSFKKFIISGGLVALGFLPWIYYVKSLGSASNSQPGLIQPTTVDLFNTFSQFLFGFQTPDTNTILVSFWPIIVLLVFMFLQKRQKSSPETFYFLLSFIVPVAISFAISIFYKPVFLSRYLIFTAPSLYILVSWMFSTYRPVVARFARFGLVAVMLFTLSLEINNAQTPVKENYKEATAYIERYASEEDVITLSAPFIIFPFLYYYHGNTLITTLPLWDRSVAGPIPPFDEKTLPTEAGKIVSGHSHLWLLLSYDQGYQSKIENYFDEHYQLVQTKSFSEGMLLKEYKLINN